MKKKAGIFICFMGIDGAGKSTLAREAIKILLNHNVRSRYVWGGYNPFFLRPFDYIATKVIIKKHNPFKNYVQYRSLLKRMGKRKVTFKIYFYSLLLDYLIQILIKIRIPLWLRRNIVSDRYIFDVATKLGSNYDFSLEKHKHLIENLFRVCPKPDLVYFLDVQPEIAMKRKQDIPSIDYLKNKTKYYRNIANAYNIQILNGSLTLANLVNFLRKDIEHFLRKAKR